MIEHPALAAGRVAVITGAASGIGLAAAKRFATMGLRVCMADLSPQALAPAADEVAAGAPDGRSAVLAVPTDVSKLEDVQKLADTAYTAFGEVAVLMNNAGTSPGGGPWDHVDRWRRVLEVNLWGVIHGVQTFTPRMLAQGTPCAIINTGSKQGITCPPGDTAYNVSKAGVKVLTEGFGTQPAQCQEGMRTSRHICWFLVRPSLGMTSRGRTEKPAGAWWPDQVVDMLIESMGKAISISFAPTTTSRAISTIAASRGPPRISPRTGRPCHVGTRTTARRSPGFWQAADIFAPSCRHQRVAGGVSCLLRCKHFTSAQCRHDS